MILRIEIIDTETITMYKKLRCERQKKINIYTASIYG